MAAVQKYQDKDILSDSQLREKQASKGNYEGITWTGDDRKTHNLQTELDRMGASRWAQTQDGKKEISQILKQVIYTERNGAGHVGFTKIIEEISKAAPKEEKAKEAAKIIPVIQKAALEEKEAAAKSPEFVVPKKVQDELDLGKKHMDLAEGAKKNGETQHAIFEYALAADFYKNAGSALALLDDDPKNYDVPKTLLKEISDKQALCVNGNITLKNNQLALENEQFKLKAAADIALSQLKKSVDSNAQFIVLKQFAFLSPSTWLPDFIRRPFRIGVDEQKTAEARAERVALIMNEYLSGNKHFAFVDGQIAPKQIMTVDQKNIDALIKVARGSATNARTEGPLKDAISKYNAAIIASQDGPQKTRLGVEKSDLETRLSEIINLAKNQNLESTTISDAQDDSTTVRITPIKISGSGPAPEVTTVAKIDEQLTKSIEKYFKVLNKNGADSETMTIKIGGAKAQRIEDYALANHLATLEGGRFIVKVPELLAALDEISKKSNVSIKSNAGISQTEYNLGYKRA